MLTIWTTIKWQRIFRLSDDALGGYTMCLAVPAKVVAIKDAMGTVDIAGVTRDVSLMLLPDLWKRMIRTTLRGPRGCAA